MKVVLALALLLQGLCMLIDEFYFHHRRGLGKWESLGHPFDTLSLILCFSFVLFIPFSETAFYFFILLSIGSCLLITKDEWIHAQECEAAEAWLHSVLFILHPIILMSLGNLYSTLVIQDSIKIILGFQLGVFILFMFYQLIYWNWRRGLNHGNG